MNEWYEIRCYELTIMQCSHASNANAMTSLTKDQWSSQWPKMILKNLWFHFVVDHISPSFHSAWALLLIAESFTYSYSSCHVSTQRSYQTLVCVRGDVVSSCKPGSSHRVWNCSCRTHACADVSTCKEHFDNHRSSLIYFSRMQLFWMLCCP